jgi:very-short-patch-repair endonuclease
VSDEFIQSVLPYWPTAVGLLVVIAIIALMRMYSAPAKLPYKSRKSLLTKSELRFYKSLQKAVLDDWEIFAMVRIADLIRVESQTRNYRGWLNKILAKHIDFVLCHPGTLEPVVCIELDDVSHNRPERMERDEFVNHAFESAGLTLIRIETQPQYKSREIRDLIEAHV